MYIDEPKWAIGRKKLFFSIVLGTLVSAGPSGLPRIDAGSAGTGSTLLQPPPRR